MVIVQIQHFLDTKGQKYFDEWLKEALDILKKVEGFIELKRLINPAYPNECHLLLTFENMDLLSKWAKSNKHDRLVAKLSEYTVKDLKSQKFIMQKI